MALKSAGCTCGTWVAWSAQDTAKFHDGECESKWAGFNGEGVGIGTLYHLAKENGWNPPHGTDNRVLTWDAIITDTPAPCTPENQITAYLCSVFEPDDQIRIVGDAYIGKEGRLCYTKGTTRSRDEWIERLKAVGVDALGPFNEYGGWCAVNPLDGKGISAGNVTRFKHTLIECDDLPIAEQERLIRALNLPVTALTHSAGKSIHAVVRVDASNVQEYRERVKRLHEVCKEAGLPVDPACKDPGRLTRLPGVLRDGKLQRLMDTHIGCESWDAWIKHLETPSVVFKPTKVAGSGPMPPPLFKNGPIPGGFGLFIGEDGIGKGWLTLDLMLSCVLGRPVNLQTVCHAGTPLRVVYLCYEDMCPVLEWRLDRICEQAEINSELWRDAERTGLLNIKALPRLPQDGNDLLPLFQQEERGIPKITEFFNALERYIAENQVNLCIIDPLAAAAILQSENDNAAMNAVGVTLRSMAARTQCTTILTHHTSKAAHGDQHHHAARGGSSLPGAGRWQLQLSQETHDASLILSIPKTSYGRRVFNVQLQREDNGVLREMTNKEMRNRARELMYKVIDWLKAHPDRVINHNAVKNKSGDAKYLVEAMKEDMGVRPMDVYDAIETARLDDLLKVVDEDHNRRPIKRVMCPVAKVPFPTFTETLEESEDDEEEIPFS